MYPLLKELNSNIFFLKKKKVEEICGQVSFSLVANGDEKYILL